MDAGCGAWHWSAYIGARNGAIEVQIAPKPRMIAD
jgi:hypothetical protein